MRKAGFVKKYILIKFSATKKSLKSSKKKDNQHQLSHQNLNLIETTLSEISIAAKLCTGDIRCTKLRSFYS